MRGRKPVPTLLRELHGNPRKVAMQRQEPRPDGDLSEAPDWLSAGQLENWTYALTNSPPGLLKRIDRGALLAWVVAEDLHRQAATAQAKVGLLVRIKTKATADKDDPGVPTASPYINIINQQAKVMLKAASELGFTPVSRPRIGAGASLLPAGPEWTTGNRGREPRQSLEDFLDSHPDRLVKH
jgi:P27 family predicted phage terminase small subunit